MRKKIEIEIDGEVLIATLLEEEAPETCKAILDVLPVEHEVVQARWSGGAMYINVPNLLPKKLDVENGTIYGSQGDVLIIDFRRPGYKYTGGDSQEFFIVYDSKGAQFRYFDGPEICNLFAKITNNLDSLQKVGETVWKTGVKKAIIRCAK